MIFKKYIDESKWKFNEVYDKINILNQRACMYIYTHTCIYIFLTAIFILSS